MTTRLTVFIYRSLLLLLRRLQLLAHSYYTTLHTLLLYLLVRDCKVIDSWVGRFPQAVTCFSPGSYANRPRQTVGGSNLFVAGDWVTGVDHGANGLSQACTHIYDQRALHILLW